jgi:LuxR family transcriptional regulator, maltose regulon positive regulatory protein
MIKSRTPLAKLSLPITYQIVARPRLFDLFGSNSGYPITWLFAPPGSGKTTLAASYAEARSLPAIWYQVDGGDADLASFFYYFGLACPTGKGRKSAKLPYLTPEYLLDIDGFSRRFFRDFFARLQPNSLLVFDNYQEVPGSALLHQILTICVDELPQGMRMFVLSRVGPPEAFARCLANRKLILFEWDQLKFTKEETLALASKGMKNLPEDVIDSLCTQSNGWAAGLVLMIERLSRSGIVNKFAWDDAMQPVFDYFADLLFNQISPENQAILLRCSFLPKIPLSVAIELSGTSAAEKLFHYLYRRHLFTDRRDSIKVADSDIDEPTYEFHALFRNFLQDRALSIFGVEERQELQRKSARLSERTGALTDALNL